MDILNDILDTLDLKGALYFRTEFTPPWAVTVPELHQAARFHLVVQGVCHVRFESGAHVVLNAGDLILIPKGRLHILSDNESREPASLEQIYQQTGYSGEGVLAIGEHDPAASTQMLCGHFEFRDGADHPLLRSLPEYILTTSVTRAKEQWLDDILRLIGRRMFSEEAGSPAAVRRLSEIVFIELLRIGIGQSDELAGLLGALSDKQIGQALRLVHAEPAHPWSVASLAQRIGMSRSRFAERFNRLVGMGPMAYLTDWRLQKALMLLTDTRLSIQEIAFESGYQSPAAFTRAFAGKFGDAPSDYRKKAA